MKVVLYSGVSIDGFIAKKDSDSDWVAEFDEDVFDQMVEWAEVVVVGRRTFEQYEGDFYPLAGVLNVVVSGDRTGEGDGWVFVGSPIEAIKLARSKGLEKILVVGGGKLNGSFLREGLVDEVVVSVIPRVIGEGVKVFEGVSKEVELELVEQEVMEKGFVKVKYRVKGRER